MRIALLLPLALLTLYAQSPADSEVKAFIDGLHWTKRVDPNWPAEVQGRGLRSEVELLVTLDTSGSVISVEPLKGLPILRQAAIDSVRQWKFQAVIRDGRPVTAMTTETILFSEPGRPVHYEPPPLEESMKALLRIHELRDRFPRSDALMLADLEQSLTGLPSKDRKFYLPSLTSAAIRAGDLPKAASYANEILAPPRDGGAVHQGNVFLGLIAVKAGDLFSAGSYLLKAGESSGGPQLAITGPNMTLAKALLEAGERDVVLQYFDECRSFWRLGANKLDEWSAVVRDGGMPDFGPNLLY